MNYDEFIQSDPKDKPYFTSNQKKDTCDVCEEALPAISSDSGICDACILEAIEPSIGKEIL